MEPWIYIVLLGGVIAVIGMLRPRTQATMDTTEIRRNMEETLEHYMAELEEENEKLLKVIERMKQEGEYRDEALRKRMDKLEQAWESNLEQAAAQPVHTELEAGHPSALSEREQELLQRAANTQDSELQETAPSQMASLPVPSGHRSVSTRKEELHAADEADDHVELHEEQSSAPIQTRYAEIFRLFQNGWTEQAIADHLGMPIGELQLIIRLGQQEGSHD
jgi:DNA-binding NarL/FixJ family response regulator